ncbi:hypothetical protein ACFL6Y_06770 [Elusimicrobiota bacterium]
MRKLFVIITKKFSFSSSPHRIISSSFSKGQATTELVLLVPLFLIFAIAIIKIFLIAIMVQKMELSMYYAGRRWMLESHKNMFFSKDKKHGDKMLIKKIKKKIQNDLGYNNPVLRKLMGLEKVDFKVKRTIVYGVLKLKVRAKGILPFQPNKIKEWEIIKYVPTRDRPIGWAIPSVAQ